MNSVQAVRFVKNEIAKPFGILNQTRTRKRLESQSSASGPGFSLSHVWAATLLSLWVHASFAESADIGLSASISGGGSGTLNYSTSSRSFNFSGMFFGYTGSGNSTYTRSSDDSIYVHSFSFHSGYGVLTVPGFSMTRSGNSYHGSFYSTLLVETVSVSIYDSNDSDGDGIPNLSDGSFNSYIPPTLPSFPDPADLPSFPDPAHGYFSARGCHLFWLFFAPAWSLWFG